MAKKKSYVGETDKMVIRFMTGGSTFALKWHVRSICYFESSIDLNSVHNYKNQALWLWKKPVEAVFLVCKR